MQKDRRGSSGLVQHDFSHTTVRFPRSALCSLCNVAGGGSRVFSLLDLWPVVYSLFFGCGIILGLDDDQKPNKYTLNATKPHTKNDMEQNLKFLARVARLVSDLDSGFFSPLFINFFGCDVARRAPILA